jgi:hypothetical protein
LNQQIGLFDYLKITKAISILSEETISVRFIFYWVDDQNNWFSCNDIFGRITTKGKVPDFLISSIPNT